ncbi:ABC transporter ATP-binding protein/permease [Patescibacteria group bacterium]|nr:ABC transporter ATP-binding protein/permease [Patescibacteria group bacterium]
MEKTFITREAVRQVLDVYWQQYRLRPAHTAIGLLSPAIGTILIFFIPPLIVAQLVNIFASQGEISLRIIGTYLTLFGGSWLIGEALWRIGIHYLIKLDTQGINNLSKIAFNRLVGQDYDFYTNNFVGTLTKRGLAFSRGFETFTDTLTFNVSSNVLPIIFALIILWRYSFWIPLVLIFWIAFVIMVALPIIRRRSKLVAVRHEAQSKVAGYLADSMTNIFAIKSFAKEREELEAYSRHVDDFTTKAKRSWDYQNLRFDTVISPMYVMANLFGLLAAIFFVQQFGLGAGVVVVVFSYYSQVTRIFWQINRVYRNIESSISEAAEFTQLLIKPPKVQDIRNAHPLKIGASNISFKNVDFKYTDGEQSQDTFLENLNLDIKGNQKIGLIGPSGGGNSGIGRETCQPLV